MEAEQTRHLNKIKGPSKTDKRQEKHLRMTLNISICQCKKIKNKLTKQIYVF